MDVCAKSLCDSGAVEVVIVCQLGIVRRGVGGMLL